MNRAAEGFKKNPQPTDRKPQQMAAQPQARPVAQQQPVQGPFEGRPVQPQHRQEQGPAQQEHPQQADVSFQIGKEQSHWDSMI